MSKSKSPTEWLDSALDLLKLEFSQGKAWTQGNGEQSWEMPPPQIITIGNKDEARKAILNQVEELIGRIIDVGIFVDPHKSSGEVLQDLRASQRTLAKQLLKGKD
jgi:hypothetical protein